MVTAKKSAPKPAAKRTKKSAVELQQQIALKRKQLADLERRAYSEKLGELVTKSGIVAAYKTIKAGAGGASDVAILSTIAKAIGMKRMNVTQTESKKRGPNKANTA